MSRHSRRTAPLDSKLGVLATYDEQEPHLIAAEWRGRVWVFAQATDRRPLTDIAILDLHDAMFAPLLDWAGRPRTEDVGPGGKVEVPFARVREELRKLGDDFDTWRAATTHALSSEQGPLSPAARARSAAGSRLVRRRVAPEWPQNEKRGVGLLG